MFSFFKKKSESRQSTGVFIPDESGFIELTDIQNLSINQMLEKQGYHPDTTHHHIVTNDVSDQIQSIIFEVFTKNVIMVITDKSVLSLDSVRIAKIANKLTFNDLYESFTVKGVLEDGINNESLTVEFLSKVLNLNDTSPNSVLYCEKLGYYLYFNEGFLTDFQSSDGLNEWAKDWKDIQPKILASYEYEAKQYWGESNTAQITKEINAQAEAWANTPEGSWQNPYTHLHKTEFGNINFVNLLLVHYGEEITLSDFKQINHGRYEVVSGFGENTTLKVGHFVYKFQDGELVDFDGAD